MRHVAPFELAAEKELTVVPEEIDKVPKKALVLDSSIWFTKFLAARVRHEYLTEEPVFLQGDPALAVFYIQSGEVRLTVRSADGEEAVITILQAGSFLGECCLAGQAARSVTARALVCSTIVRIEKQAMMGLLHDNSEFAERFLEYTLFRSIRMEADLAGHSFNPSDECLVRLQMMKGNFSGEWKLNPVTAKMSLESLAKLLGATDSSVSFILERFCKLGLIDSKSVC
jgi:CRP-like cAMP-binding protein